MEIEKVRIGPAATSTVSEKEKVRLGATATSTVSVHPFQNQKKGGEILFSMHKFLPRGT